MHLTYITDPGHGWLLVTVAQLAEGMDGYEIEAFGERSPVMRHTRPPYDPDGTRLRG